MENIKEIMEIHLQHALWLKEATKRKKEEMGKNLAIRREAFREDMKKKMEDLDEVIATLRHYDLSGEGSLRSAIATDAGGKEPVTLTYFNKCLSLKKGEQHLLNIGPLFIDPLFDADDYITSDMIEVAKKYLDPWDKVLATIVSDAVKAVTEAVREEYKDVCDKYLVTDIKWMITEELARERGLPSMTYIYAASERDIKTILETETSKGVCVESFHAEKIYRKDLDDFILPEEEDAGNGVFAVEQIDWDTDGEAVELPERVRVRATDIDDIADVLSDLYGFCVKSFSAVQLK